MVLQSARDRGLASACHRESLQKVMLSMGNVLILLDLTLLSWLLLSTSSPGLHEQRQ